MKDYESIKVEKAVYKRLVYIKEVMKDKLKGTKQKGRITMSTVLNDALSELQIQIDNANYRKDKS